MKCMGKSYLVAERATRKSKASLPKRKSVYIKSKDRTRAQKGNSEDQRDGVRV